MQTPPPTPHKRGVSGGTVAAASALLGERTTLDPTMAPLWKPHRLRNQGTAVHHAHIVPNMDSMLHTATQLANAENRRLQLNVSNKMYQPVLRPPARNRNSSSQHRAARHSDVILATGSLTRAQRLTSLTNDNIYVILSRSRQKAGLSTALETPPNKCRATVTSPSPQLSKARHTRLR